MDPSSCAAQTAPNVRNDKDKEDIDTTIVDVNTDSVHLEEREEGEISDDDQECAKTPRKFTIRCSPDAFNFLNRMVYLGDGTNDASSFSAQAENDSVRQACRRFTFERGCFNSYNTAIGNLLIGVNVPGGVCVKQAGIPSRVNYAECETALQYADQLLRQEGINGSDILIMSYFDGNVDLMSQLQTSYPRTNGIEIRLVDECQDRTSKIAIVVMGATSFWNVKSVFAADRVFDRISSKLQPHVRSADRLNLAMTRASDLVIVVANFFSISTLKVPCGGDKDTTGTVLQMLVMYLLSRNLVLDSHIVDKNPELGLVNNAGKTARYLDVAAQGNARGLNWVLGNRRKLRALREIEVRGTDQGH